MQKYSNVLLENAGDDDRKGTGGDSTLATLAPGRPA
jgi:hypothetical protein